MKTIMFRAVCTYYLENAQKNTNNIYVSTMYYKAK